jgi:hypothetical protein
MSLGSRYAAHVAYFEGLSGYNEAKKTIGEDFEPASTADKTFIYRWILKTHGKQTGKHEVSKLTFQLKILYKKGQNQAYSAFYEALWDEIETVEKNYLDWGDGSSGQDRVWVEEITSEPLDENFELVTFTGMVNFLRSLVV